MTVYPRIECLEWLAGRRAAAMHDLAAVGLRGSRDVGSAAVPEPVADLPDPPAGVNLHSLLATAYGVHPRQVVVTAGASHAAFLAAATAVTLAGENGTEGPRVAVEAPGYEPHQRTSIAAGAAVDRFDRGSDGALDSDALGAACESDTALATVTNRHNPTGALADRETLADAAAAARESGTRLFVDEVYAPYVLERRADGAFGGPTAAGLDGAVVANSVSKFFGLPDLRVGWLIADETFAERARAVKHHVPGVSAVTERLAARAVHAADDLATDRRELLGENAARLAAFVADRPDVQGTVHDGANVALLDVDGWSGDDLAAAAWDAGVLVVPGRFFGDPGRVRVALGRDPVDGDAALRALAAVVAGGRG